MSKTKELKQRDGAEEVKNRPSQFWKEPSHERLFLSTGGARFVTKRRRREVAAAAGDGNAAVRGEVVSECGLWGGNARLPSTRHLIHETKLTCLEPTVTSTCGASSAPAWKWRFNRELSIRKRDFNTVLKM